MLPKKLYNHSPMLPKNYTTVGQCYLKIIQSQFCIWFIFHHQTHLVSCRRYIDCFENYLTYLIPQTVSDKSIMLQVSLFVPYVWLLLSLVSEISLKYHIRTKESQIQNVIKLCRQCLRGSNM